MVEDRHKETSEALKQLDQRVDMIGRKIGRQEGGNGGENALVSTLGGRGEHDEIDPATAANIQALFRNAINDLFKENYE